MSESTFSSWSGPESETDRQSHPIDAWGACPSSGMWPQAVPNPGNDTTGLGSYVPINLPSNPGPRAADVFPSPASEPPGGAESAGPVDVFGFPGVGGGNRSGGSGGMYGLGRKQGMVGF
jgi:hypothetical protein